MAELVNIEEQRERHSDERKSYKKMFLITAAVILVGLAVLAALSYYFNNRCYNSFEVENTVERSDSNNVKYMYFNQNLLKYSRSGISAVDNTGKSLWNGGFEMKQPQIDTCGDYVLAADVTGKQFYVYNGKDEGTGIETTMPIVRGKVAGQGVAAVLLQDSDSNVLNIYNPYSSADSLLVEIPTNVSGEGYPVDFDISPDGNSVVVSYLIVSGNSLENKVSFYNFTEVGQDKNTIVGGQNFGENMVSRIEFVGPDKAAVFHEKGFCLFARMKQPQMTVEKVFDETIQSMAYSEEFIAVVTGDEKGKKQTLRLFDMDGREKLTCNIDYEYSGMEIYKDDIIFLSNRSCHIIRTNGKEKFNCNFEDDVEALFPTGNGSMYTLIDASAIKKIRLTG